MAEWKFNFPFARLYCMTSQMSGDYNSWVQLAWFIQRGCEHSHNSIKTGLLGLHDLAVLKERHQSLRNPFTAMYFYSVLLFDKLCKLAMAQRAANEDQYSFNISWTSKTIYQGFSKGDPMPQTRMTLCESRTHNKITRCVL